jgi:HlyD family secretion protein
MNHRMKRITKIFLVLVIFLLSACEGKLSGLTPTAEETKGGLLPVITATGKVVPSEWATMSVKNTGVIEELRVVEGQSVNQGDVIMRLSGREQIEASITSAEMENIAALQALENLDTDLEKNRAVAGQRLADARKLLEDAEKKRSYKDYGRASQATLDSARANYILAQDAFEEREKDFNDVAWMGEDDINRAAVLSQYAAARAIRDRELENLNWLLGRPNDVEIAQADAAVAVAKTEVEASQRAVDDLKDGPDPDQLELVQARVRNADEALEAAKKSLGDLDLVAPFSGTISKLYVREQEWISPGQPVVLLADLNHLIIETTDLSEIDVAQVNVGSPAIVTFDALPEITATAKVSRIAPKSSEGSGVNYTVIIEFEGTPERLMWGMTAFVDIQVNN